MRRHTAHGELHDECCVRAVQPMEIEMRAWEWGWRDIETYLKADNRVVLALGSFEQHDGLSLATDTFIGERMAVEAAEPLGIPVYPAIPYGVAPFFQAYPGSINIRVQTYLSFVRDILDSFRRTGFKRIFVLNAHAGNAPVDMLAREWMMDNEGYRIRYYEWWKAPATVEKINEIDPAANHAAWNENFPFTRLKTTNPDDIQPRVNTDLLTTVGPKEVRRVLGGGNYHGRSQRPDADTETVWTVAVAEARAAMERWE